MNVETDLTDGTRHSARFGPRQRGHAEPRLQGLPQRSNPQDFRAHWQNAPSARFLHFVTRSRVINGMVPRRNDLIWGLMAAWADVVAPSVAAVVDTTEIGSSAA